MKHNKQEIHRKFKKEDFENNPEKFIQHFRYGFNPHTGNLGILPLLNFEKAIIKHMHNNTYSLINKSRQMHLSSIMAAYMAWNLIYKKNFFILGIFPSLSQGAHFKQTILYTINNLPPEILNKDEILLNNKKELLINNNKFQIISTHSVPFKAQSVDMLVFDESEFIKDLDRIFSCFMMLLKETRKIIMTSTPNYKGSFFERCYRAVSTKKQHFSSLDVHWSINPHYNKGLKTARDKDGNDTLTSPWYEQQKIRYNYIQEAIDSELNLKFKNPPENKTKTISLRLETTLLDEVEKKLFTTNDMNISKYIRTLIENDLKNS